VHDDITQRERWSFGRLWGKEGSTTPSGLINYLFNGLALWNSSLVCVRNRSLSSVARQLWIYAFRNLGKRGVVPGIINQQTHQRTVSRSEQDGKSKLRVETRWP